MTTSKELSKSQADNNQKPGFMLADYVGTVFNVEGRDLGSRHLYRSKNILTTSQFSRLVSIFEPHEKQLEELLSNFGELWTTPSILRKLELVVSDEVWNIAGRYIDYITPDRSLGWDAQQYIGMVNA
jgi:hypothetical protein